MRLDRVFVVAVCVLQLSAAVVYACRRQWAQAVMMFGAGVANGAVLFLPARP